jgi:Ion channel
VGGAAVLCTVLIQALPLSATLSFIRWEIRLGRTGRGFWIDMGIVTLVIGFLLAAHLMQVGLWAFVFLLCGEFRDVGTAYYHSAVNFTTLGYGDVLLSPQWRLLGPLEAADGMLLFGVSTAMIFAIIMKLVQARYVEV